MSAVPAVMLLSLCRDVQGAVSASLSPHPQIGATQADWSSLGDRRMADPDLDRLVLALLDRARQDLQSPLLNRQLDGRRLLSVSREFIRRSLLWAFAYRVSGERVFLDRVRQEMLNVAGFSDWNPQHYLDVAEMTTGMAIAYGWLFDGLSFGDRALLRTAIVDKGIAQARHGHKTFRYTNNWNQVCIGGMVLGALAVQDGQSVLAADVLSVAKQHVSLGLNVYRPDGVYPEGPGYWDYGTGYSVLLAASLRAAKGNDWGILAAPGFKRSAEFYAHAMGPSGHAFNFADGGESPGFPCAMVYLARELRQPTWLSFMRQVIRSKQGPVDRFAPLAALWWPAESSGKWPATTFMGQGEQPVAIWRSSWADPNALWLAIKGGGAAHNHAHMDAGSFILDWGGLRWAKDLGMQDYSKLEFRGIDLWNMQQDSSRWDVFRLSAQAHNTLTLNDQPHNAMGMASLHEVNDREAVIDLTSVLLSGPQQQALRRIRFADDAVFMEDVMQGVPAASVVRWAMNTEADVQIEGNAAVLTQKGKRLRVQFEGIGLRLDVVDISLPRRDYDAPNPRVKQLLVIGRAGVDGRWRLRSHFLC